MPPTDYMDLIYFVPVVVVYLTTDDITDKNIINIFCSFILTSFAKKCVITQNSSEYYSAVTTVKSVTVN